MVSRLVRHGAKAAFYDGSNSSAATSNTGWSRTAWERFGGAAFMSRAAIWWRLNGVDLTRWRAAYRATAEFYGALDVAIESVDNDEGEDLPPCISCPASSTRSPMISIRAEAGFRSTPTARIT